MTVLFNREISVQIGERLFESPPFSISGESSFGNSGIGVSKIVLYNPHPLTIQEAKVKNQQLSVEVGYSGEKTRIIAGEIFLASEKKESGNITLEMSVSDKRSVWFGYYVNKLFENSTASTILKSIAESAGITIEKIAPKNDINIPRYYAARVRDAVIDLSRRSGSVWYFRRGSLVVEDPADKKGEVIKVNGNTGLIGTPEVTGSRIKFKSVLLHLIGHGSICEITYGKEIVKKIRVDSGKMKFSSHSADSHYIEAEGAIVQV